MGQTEHSDPTEASGPSDYFAKVTRMVRDMLAACDTRSEHFLTLAAETVRLIFTNPSLVDLVMPAFAHLVSEEISDPSLTVFVGDETSTKRAFPLPPWPVYTDHRLSPNQVGVGQDRYYYRDGRFNFYFSPDVPINLFDRSSRTAYWWMHDAGLAPYWERGAPLRLILNWWAAARGLAFIHSGAIASTAGAALLAGGGGSGKSTTSLASVGTELKYLSDDYCIVAPEPEPAAHSVYCAGKLNPDSLARLPHLRKFVARRSAEDEKALLFVAPGSGLLARSSPVRAILVPRLTQESRTTVEPTSAMVGLRALLPSTVFQLPGNEHFVARSMASVVKRLPCYYLNLGSDLRQISAVVESVLSGHGQSQAGST